MGRTSIYYDLVDAFGGQGCPACCLAARSVLAWLDSVSYESVNDPGVRAQLRASYGFCNVHAYQWMEQRHLLGTVIIYRDVLDLLTQALSRVEYRKEGLLTGVSALLNGTSRVDSTTMGLAPEAECPVCQSQAESERITIATLIEGLEDPKFREAYTTSEGLCLPHLRLALSAAPGESSFRVLVRAALDYHEILRRQLDEIERRYDYRFNKEPEGEERGAGLRAVRHVVGHQGVRGMDLDGRAGR